MAPAITRAIVSIYYLLFLATPLVLTPWNYELFEFNKMLLVYSGSIIIGTLWTIRMILEKRVLLHKTPLDIPIALLLTSHLISTVHSIDPHISVWGYYGRFNGGLMSLISYLVLYYGLVSNVPVEKNKKTIHTMLIISLISGLLVSLYGIAQHFGIDAHLWVQDVQNRVFSTLGQPNWLAAYLAILMPVAMAFMVVPPSEYRISNHMFRISRFIFLIVAMVFYITLLYTKSRSGFLAFWIANVAFWAGTYGSTLRKATSPAALFRWAAGIHLALVIITISIGSPFDQINKVFTVFENRHEAPQQETPSQPTSTTSAEAAPPVQTIHITDSGEIRKLVWEGAVEATRARPYFGWGVDTFAWVYYQFKPVEHNHTSEWDFLYNKAHNEYLNYAATTGLIGLGTYLLVIGSFAIWFLVQLLRSTHTRKHTISIGLFAGWVSLLVTNFFGFTVVITSLYFWLIPACVVTLLQKYKQTNILPTESLSLRQWILVGICASAALYLLSSVALYWHADTRYAEARSAYARGNYSAAYREITQAIAARPYEPVYHDQLASTLAHLAAIQYEREQNTQETVGETATATELAEKAIASSNSALQLSPGNITFWKSRTRMFYNMSAIDDSYARDALKTILEAQSRAPTDPLITYNVGIVYEINNDRENALLSFKKALELKKDYKDAAWALAIFYEDENPEESERWLHYILEQIDPHDIEVKKKLGQEIPQ